VIRDKVFSKYNFFKENARLCLGKVSLFIILKERDKRERERERERESTQKKKYTNCFSLSRCEMSSFLIENGK